MGKQNCIAGLCHKFQLDFDFYNVNFYWFMCCQMCDLISQQEIPSTKACIRKAVSITKEINKQSFPSFVMSLERSISQEHQRFFVFSYSHLNTGEVGRILEIFANRRLRLGFAYIFRIMATPRVQLTFFRVDGAAANYRCYNSTRFLEKREEGLRGTTERTSDKQSFQSYIFLAFRVNNGSPKNQSESRLIAFLTQA